MAAVSLHVRADVSQASEIQTSSASGIAKPLCGADSKLCTKMMESRGPEKIGPGENGWPRFWQFVVQSLRWKRPPALGGDGLHRHIAERASHFAFLRWSAMDAWDTL